MIVSDFFTPEIIEFIKIIAILIGLVHMLAGFILVFQTFRMNRIIKTSNAPVFNLIVLVYLAVLVTTLFFIITA